jgi:hypothetical protein
MSSRSLAVARARRAGEAPPPVSGNRPGTSIGSQAAFANQQMYQNQNNVRVGRQPQGQQQFQPQGQQQFQQQGQPGQQGQQGQPGQNKLGFNKISISDAIGLITLRLGRVETYIIESEHEKEINNNESSDNLSANSQVIDSSILNNIINRIDSLEKKESVPEDITKLTEQLTRISDESNKHTLAISKHTEQLFKFERELIETKDILKTFMIKYDTFAKESNDRFGDFEYAISELEKNINLPLENIEESSENDDKTSENVEESSENNEETYEEDELSKIESNTIISDELKNILKQELSIN